MSNVKTVKKVKTVHEKHKAVEKAKRADENGMSFYLKLQSQ